MPDIYMYTPTNFAHLTSGWSWDRRSYWGADYPHVNIVPLRTTNEASSDDWVVCDPSTLTPIYSYKSNRVSYSYLPFIMTNQTSVRLYDIGFKFYDNPSETIAESIFYFGDDTTNKYDAVKSDSSYNINSFTTNNTGIIPMGVMTSAEYATRETNLKNLTHGSYWNASKFGALTIASISDLRPVLSPSRLTEAITWFTAGAGETGSYSDGTLNISYPIKKWGDGGRENDFFQYGTSFTSDSTIEIPANGAMWGYIYFTATDSNTSEINIKSDGSGYGVQTHGKWTTGNLLESGIYEATTYPWSGAAAYARRIEYGLHVVARKAGV